MTYLYNYYYSNTVHQIALRLGFAALPDYVRDTVVTKLINVAMCNNGQYALAAYKTFPTPILSSTAFILTLASYLSVYNAIDSQLAWSVQSYEDSSVVNAMFAANPATYGGAFTLMSSKQVRASPPGLSLTLATPSPTHPPLGRSLAHPPTPLPGLSPIPAQTYHSRIPPTHTTHPPPPPAGETRPAHRPLNDHLLVRQHRRRAALPPLSIFRVGHRTAADHAAGARPPYPHPSPWASLSPTILPLGLSLTHLFHLQALGAGQRIIKLFFDPRPANLFFVRKSARAGHLAIVRKT